MFSNQRNYLQSANNKNKGNTVTSEKAGRNKTIDTSVSEGVEYLNRCITINEQQNSIHSVLDKTILGDTFTVCSLLPPNSIDLIIADPPYNLTKSFMVLFFLEKKNLIMKNIQEDG